MSDILVNILEGDKILSDLREERIATASFEYTTASIIIKEASKTNVIVNDTIITAVVHEITATTNRNSYFPGGW